MNNSKFAKKTHFFIFKFSIAVEKLVKMLGKQQD